VAGQRFTEGDRVRIDIPDEDDIDNQYHGKHGTVIDIITDDLHRLTGFERDKYMYTIQFSDDTTLHCRQRDLRPPLH